MKVALLDADIVAYQFASAAEERTNWGEGVVSVSMKRSLDEAAARMDEDIAALGRKLKVDKVIACLSDSANFRKGVLPSYKSNRAGGEKPKYLADLKRFLADNYECFIRPGLEADDCMGILATHPTLVPGRKVIVSIDKDMKQIPGWLFNPDKHDAPVKVTEAEGLLFHMTQALTGDAVDGYKGCPNIGPKKAERLLKQANGIPRLMWEIVVDTYCSRGLSEEDALVQARVARICQWQDYDYKLKEVKLWQPPEIESSGS